MNGEDVVAFYAACENAGILIWIDGGWAVDALLGEQTRPHADLDIALQQQDLPKLRRLLEAQGFADVPRDDTQPWNFVLGDAQGRLVDVHAIVLDGQGNGLYGPVEKGVMYPAASLTGTGTIHGQSMRCISAEYLVKFHSGYALDEDDFRDVSALCAKFGIELPEEYRH